MDAATFGQLLIDHAHRAVLAPPDDESTHLSPALDDLNSALVTLSSASPTEQIMSTADDIAVLASQSERGSDSRILRLSAEKIVQRACADPSLSSTYAPLCARMAKTVSPAISDADVADKDGAPVVGGALFEKHLLNQCQAEFESSDGVKPGVLQFLAALYETGLLPLRVACTCIRAVLEQEGGPDGSVLVGLVALLRAVRPAMTESEKGVQMMQSWLERVEKTRERPGLDGDVRKKLGKLLDEGANLKSP